MYLQGYNAPYDTHAHGKHQPVDGHKVMEAGSTLHRSKTRSKYSSPLKHPGYWSTPQITCELG